MLLNTGNGVDLLNTVCYCYKSLNGFTVNWWDDTCILNLFERSKLLVSGGGGIFFFFYFHFSFLVQCLSENRKLSKGQNNKSWFIM